MIDLVKQISKPRAATKRTSLRSRIGWLLEHVQRGDRAWTIGVILAAILVFVTFVVSIVLTIVELAALLA